MQVLSLLLVMLQATPDTSALGQGWQGNLHLQENELGAARDAYQRGLDLYRDGRAPDAVYYGLQNNLGLALHGQGDFSQAGSAFREAAETAAGNLDAARALYNAGNNAFGTQAHEAALDHYRRALLADPQNEDARFNYEYVKRLQQQNQQQDQQQQNQQQDQRQEQQQDPSQGEENQDPSQGEDEQQSQGDPQQEPLQGEPQQQDTPQQPQGTPLSPEEAERILQALEYEEKELLRQVQKVEGRPRRVTKDW